MQSAARVSVQRFGRRFAHASSKEQFPPQGLGHGGHINQLQSEGSIRGKWFNYGKNPELGVLAVICGSACVLAGYKMVVVDTFKVPFVKRL